MPTGALTAVCHTHHCENMILQVYICGQWFNGTNGWHLGSEEQACSPKVFIYLQILDMVHFHFALYKQWDFQGLYVGHIPTVQTDPPLSPVLLSTDQNGIWWVKAVLQKALQLQHPFTSDHWYWGRGEEGAEEELRQTGLQPESSESVCGLDWRDRGSGREILPSHSGVGSSARLLATEEGTAEVFFTVNTGWYDGR